jgi:hypothetical protein
MGRADKDFWRRTDKFLAVQRPPMGWVRRNGGVAKEIRILLGFRAARLKLRFR